MQWRNAAIVAALMMVAGMGCTAYAEQTISSSLAVVFVACVPMLMVLLSLWFGVQTDRIELCGIAVGFVGVLLLVGGQGFGASPLGLAAMCVAVTGWSIGSVLSRHRLPLAPGAMGYASEMVCGGVGMSVVAALRGEQLQWPPEPTAFVAWVYLIVFGSLIAFNAYMFLLTHVRPAVASSYTLVCPVVGLALGYSVGGEQLTSKEWTASGVMLLGVLLLLWGASRRKK